MNRDTFHVERAHEVWKAFGIGDRFGFSIVGGHGHANFQQVSGLKSRPSSDKFLLGEQAGEYGHLRSIPLKAWLTNLGTMVGSRESRPFRTGSHEDRNGVSRNRRRSSRRLRLDRVVGWIGIGRQVSHYPIGTQQFQRSADQVREHGAATVQGEPTSNVLSFRSVKCPTADDDSFWIKNR